jgi:hypothetical protein
MINPKDQGWIASGSLLTNYTGIALINAQPASAMKFGETFPHIFIGKRF